MSRIDLTELLGQVDIESWLDREGVDYKIAYGSSGVQANVRQCPECGDDRWKVYLNTETGLGNCFVCEEKFNKWKFIKLELGLDNRQAIEHLKQVASEAGWTPRKVKTNDVAWTRGELIIPISYSLPINGRNLQYLEERHIDIETAQYFRLRYSHSGVFKYSANGDEIAQSYARRIIIPIFDLDGTLVSFQGRDITDKAEKKYLFPPGYASTGKYLYNAHNAIGAQRILVGEGVFDVMAAKLALDTEVDLRDVIPVGTFGKHLSASGDGDDQFGAFLKLQKQGLRHVTFMWDGSRNALLAAVDAGLKLREIGLDVYIAELPKDKDPNEVLAEQVVSAYWKATRLTLTSAVKLKIRHS